MLGMDSRDREHNLALDAPASGNKAPPRLFPGSSLARWSKSDEPPGMDSGCYEWVITFL